ncbi:hypothetical protein PHYSODRAFT_307817 [Phytophthora sojae]|uniref:Uncharacterized protein n=1 Tax=Phytophthora sojae (strain P6497) TaxID=1094619 RepID=G5AG75_PHYSP|nr:hypothetical protein PHYSODRAFT_307817 [Phytophthora sojae]EGZ05587.1 hypothetical protein PHYSODRAFT_307817 [Phytophthora sojae]|eukprot:XP_009539118.1 hypothetical protein PHYSODRAFT_307817 [Phytophthora sojae]
MSRTIGELFELVLQVRAALLFKFFLHVAASYQIRKKGLELKLGVCHPIRERLAEMLGRNPERRGSASVQRTRQLMLGPLRTTLASLFLLLSVLYKRVHMCLGVRFAFESRRHHWTCCVAVPAPPGSATSVGPSLFPKTPATNASMGEVTTVVIGYDLKCTHVCIAF